MPASPPDPATVGAVRDGYDAVAEDYAARLPDTRAESRLDLAMVDTFADRAARAGGGRILDAGCGTGRMSRYLADRGCRVDGVDLSPRMAAMARRDHGDLHFTVGSLTNLPYADGQFAGVLLWYSMIHMHPSEHLGVATEVARVLSPRGHVLVGFQSGEGTREVAWSYRRGGREVHLVRHLVTADGVAATLAAVGMREVCRVVRRAEGTEEDDQAFVLVQAG